MTNKPNFNINYWLYFEVQPPLDSDTRDQPPVESYQAWRYMPDVFFNPKYRSSDHVKTCSGTIKNAK